MRGEGFDGHDAGTLTPGRSPRARGRHIATIRDLLKDRSIPACAGKARKSKGGDLARRVDPRVRGEGTDYGDQGNPRRGRSPRARGRHARGETAGDRIRSIPACAGKAEHSHHCRYRKQVDPRVRGEGCTGSYEESRAGGRSPRARGRHLQSGKWPEEYGSIPACAGKAVKPTAHVEVFQVDPRVRGEGALIGSSWPSGRGRSPRARGRRPFPFQDIQRLGSIPACAGKAPTPPPNCQCLKVDPRVRGEGTIIIAHCQIKRGRSPRARGRLIFLPHVCYGHRSIPACAGKALADPVDCTDAEVDPRVRGEG